MQTAANLGNSNYRAGDSVDIETGGSSGNVVGYTAVGEWLNYTIEHSNRWRIHAAKPRSPMCKAASASTATLRGKNVTGELNIPATSGWQTYATVTSASFSLSAGTQVLQIYLDHAAANSAVRNLNWIKLVPSSSIVTPPAGETPFLGTPFTTSEHYSKFCGFMTSAVPASPFTPRHRKIREMTICGAIQIPSATSKAGGNTKRRCSRIHRRRRMAPIYRSSKVATGRELSVRSAVGRQSRRRRAKIHVAASTA